MIASPHSYFLEDPKPSPSGDFLSRRRKYQFLSNEFSTAVRHEMSHNFQSCISVKGIMRKCTFMWFFSIAIFIFMVANQNLNSKTSKRKTKDMTAFFYFFWFSYIWTFVHFVECISRISKRSQQIILSFVVHNKLENLLYTLSEWRQISMETLMWRSSSKCSNFSHIGWASDSDFL